MVQNCRAPFIRAHRFHSWLCNWVFECIVYDVCSHTAGQYGKEVPHWYSKYSWALKFLEWGYTAVFVELDMVFLKDPLPFFNKEEYDFQGLSDWRVPEVPDAKVCLAHMPTYIKHVYIQFNSSCIQVLDPNSGQPVNLGQEASKQKPGLAFGSLTRARLAPCMTTRASRFGVLQTRYQKTCQVYHMWAGDDGCKLSQTFVICAIAPGTVSAMFAVDHLPAAISGGCCAADQILQWGPSDDKDPRQTYHVNPCVSTGFWFFQPTEPAKRYLQDFIEVAVYSKTEETDQIVWNEVGRF